MESILIKFSIGQYKQNVYVKYSDNTIREYEVEMKDIPEFIASRSSHCREIHVFGNKAFVEKLQKDTESHSKFNKFNNIIWYINS